MGFFDKMKEKFKEYEMDLRMMNFWKSIERDTSLETQIRAIINYSTENNFKLKFPSSGILKFYSVSASVTDIKNLSVNQLKGKDDKIYNKSFTDDFLLIYEEIYNFVKNYELTYTDKRFVKKLKLYKDKWNFVTKQANYANSKLLSQFFIISNSLEDIGWKEINKDKLAVSEDSEMLLIERAFLSKPKTLKAVLFLLKKKDELIQNLGVETFTQIKNEKLEELLGLDVEG